MDKQGDRVNVMLGGREYVIVPRDEYMRLAGLANAAVLPSLPAPDADGNYPASAYMKASLSRKLIKGRIECGLTQPALAQRAGITVERLNQIEAGLATPTLAIMTKIDAVLKKTVKASVKQDGRRLSKKRA